ncbi:MAG: hypoxanthine phosphoribosyltransferase [bacterium]
MNFKLLISEKEISEKISELAAEIDTVLRDDEVIVIGVLKGALFFMADLLRKMKTKVVYDFIQAKSYEGMETTGKIKILKEPSTDFTGKTVLIVEDILDTGITLSQIKRYFEERKAKKVYICTLLNKRKRRVSDIDADFTGFEIEDHFVIGYGLDYDEKMRELKDIYIVKQC